MNAPASPPPEGLPGPRSADAPVVLYTTPWCGYCRAALRLLSHRQIEHVNVNVMANGAARRWLADATGQNTVPQIFVHGQSIGGYTELAQLDDDGTLASLLADGPPAPIG